MATYAENSSTFQKCGFWARPIKPGTKACPIKNWQRPDENHGADTIENWNRKYAHYGIGLLMGSPICDGTRLGALDVDRDEYVPLANALLRNPICGRVGQKGAVFFVRVHGNLGNPEFRVTGEIGKRWGKIAECLFDRKLCVIPPTIHPKTNSAYRWIGPALHEVDLLSLPLIGE